MRVGFGGERQGWGGGEEREKGNEEVRGPQPSGGVLCAGVRKHCRKHHAEWLAQLDNTMRENNQKHSAANYCSTHPSHPMDGGGGGGDLAVTHLRKRHRTDSAATSIANTPTSTPRLEPSRGGKGEVSTLSLVGNIGTPVQTEKLAAYRPTGGEGKERREVPKEDMFPASWPSFSDEESMHGAEAPE